MNAQFLGGLAHLLGFIGLASIGLLPLRSWQVLKKIIKSDVSGAPRKALAIFVVLTVAVALWSDMQITARVFICLTETYCGPGIASGWTYLALLGAAYLSFEVVIFVLQKILSSQDNLKLHS